MESFAKNLIVRCAVYPGYDQPVTNLGQNLALRIIPLIRAWKISHLSYCFKFSLGEKSQAPPPTHPRRGLWALGGSEMAAPGGRCRAEAILPALSCLGGGGAETPGISLASPALSMEACSAHAGSAFLGPVDWRSPTGMKLSNMWEFSRKFLFKGMRWRIKLLEDKGILEIQHSLNVQPQWSVGNRVCCPFMLMLPQESWF